MTIQAEAVEMKFESAPSETSMLSNDIADWPTIPARVRERIVSLREVSGDRHAMLMAVSDELRPARDELSAAEVRLKELNSNISARLSEIETHPDVINSKSRIDIATAKVTRLTARYEELKSAWEHAARLDRGVEKYVLDNHAAGIVLHAGHHPELKDGETALAGLDRASRRTRTLQADRREILAAPFPTSFAKKLARAQLEERIAAARPDVTGLVDRGENIEFPQNRTSLSQYGGSTGAVYVVDPIGLLAWLFPNDFHAAIDKEIDKAGDDEAALTSEQRTEKLRQIGGDILASEREEARFSELAGLLPRVDIDPRAFLNLSDDMQGPKRD